MHPVNTLTAGQALGLVREARHLVKQLRQTLGRNYDRFDVGYRAIKRLHRRVRLFERVINRENELRALSTSKG